MRNAFVSFETSVPDSRAVTIEDAEVGDRRRVWGQKRRSKIDDNFRRADRPTFVRVLFANRGPRPRKMTPLRELTFAGYSHTILTHPGQRRGWRHV